MGDRKWGWFFISVYRLPDRPILAATLISCHSTIKTYHTDTVNSISFLHTTTSLKLSGDLKKETHLVFQLCFH